jgi:hypothetical protein
MDAWCCGVLGYLGYLRGEPDFGRAAVEHAVRVSESLAAVSRLNAHGSLGIQLLLDGQADQAIESLEYALSLATLGSLNFSPHFKHVLAQAWLAAGNPKSSRAVAEESLTHCLQIGIRVGAIEAAVALSAALRSDAGVAAAPRIDEVLATAERLIAETGAVNLTPFVLLARVIHGFHVARAPSVRQIGPSAATTDAGIVDTMSRREERARSEMACNRRSQQGIHE